MEIRKADAIDRCPILQVSTTTPFNGGGSTHHRKLDRIARTIRLIRMSQFISGDLSGEEELKVHLRLSRFFFFSSRYRDFMRQTICSLDHAVNHLTAKGTEKVTLRDLSKDHTGSPGPGADRGTSTARRCGRGVGGIARQCICCPYSPMPPPLFWRSVVSGHDRPATRGSGPRPYHLASRRPHIGRCPPVLCAVIRACQRCGSGARPMGIA